GGFVREVFSHFAYLSDRLLGPLRTIEGRVEYPDDPAVSEISAHGDLQAGDVPVHLTGQVGAAAPGIDEWTLWGSRKSYQLRAWSRLFTSDGGEWAPVDMPPAGHSGTLANLAAAIRGEEQERLADFAAAFRVQQAVEAFFP